MTRTCLAALVSLLCACGGAPGPWLADARVLVQGVGMTNQDCRAGFCQHNENTDLARWKGAIWLVHRTALSQVLGPNSSLHIYRSGDGGRTYEEKARILAPADRDLRDPAFYTVGGALYLKALTRLPVTSARDSDVDTVTVMSHSDDGVSWSDLVPIGPHGQSFWRVVAGPGGVFYSAAYEDGDKSVTLFSSSDGVQWERGPLVYGVSADTPLETELIFLPRAQGQPLLAALVRMDGTDIELLGTKGRLRTKVCTAEAPYAQFDCSFELTGQRLDGPVAVLWRGRLFVVARKHLGDDGRKRTALFELQLGGPGGAPSGIVERGELPSAGDTAYAGLAPIDDHRYAVTWYSSDLRRDPDWLLGILGATDIWAATIDLAALPAK
jgi:hypothetical protein